MNVLDSLREAFRQARKKQPGLTEAMADEALVQIVARLGGERIVMPKTLHGRPGRPDRPSLPPEVQAAAYEDGLTNASTAELTAKYSMSRATLYRLMKKGRPEGGSK